LALHKPRAVALKSYPANLKLGFDRKGWLDRCLELNARDNDPPYRDEQRAWYDTLRDFCGLILGLPTVRLLPQEARWCSFNASSRTDVKHFKSIVQHKLALCHGNRSSSKSFKVGLAFPELKKHDIGHFLKVIDRSAAKLDLLILPEGFEIIRPKRHIRPENIADDSEVAALTKKYAHISGLFETGVIVGFKVDYASTLTSGGGNDQYALVISRDERPYIYHKHSSSRYNAFFDSTWSIPNNLKVIRIGAKKVGVSVCHDSYISLIPKSLKQKGAEIWVNISYQNVRPAVWEPIHRTRAVENNFISVCTLHRNSHAANPQREPYAFCEKGKIILLDLENGHNIDDAPFKDRAGKIYVFDAHNRRTSPTKDAIESQLSSKADQLVVKSASGQGPSVNDSHFIFKSIGIETFVHRPEKLWKICLDNRDEVVLFVTHLQSTKEWERHRGKVMSVIKGRTIEFSTLFLFICSNSDVLMAAYRSSNYKDCRIFNPKRFPFAVDRRYLKGLKSTYNISLNDCRKEEENIYFQKVQRMVDFVL